MNQTEKGNLAADINRTITENGRVTDNMKKNGINEAAAYAFEFVLEMSNRGIEDEDLAGELAEMAHIDAEDYRAATAII